MTSSREKIIVGLSYLLLLFTILTLVLDVFVAEATIFGCTLRGEPVNIWDLDGEDQIVASIVFNILAVIAAVVATAASMAHFFSYEFKGTLITSFTLVSLFSAVAWVTFIEIAERLANETNEEAEKSGSSYKQIYRAGFGFMVANTFLGALSALFVMYSKKLGFEEGEY